jgi:hypothetical protein
MDRRMRALQENLERLGAQVREPRPDDGEPLHLHRSRDEADGSPERSRDATLPNREAVGG